REAPSSDGEDPSGVDHAVTDRNPGAVTPSPVPKLLVPGVPDTADLPQLLNRTETPMPLAIVQDPSGEHRPYPWQRVQLLQGGGVEIDRTAHRCRSSPAGWHGESSLGERLWRWRDAHQ